jgi:hypothetical protein
MLEYPIRVWGSPRVITVSPLCNGPGPVTQVYLIDCPTPVRVRVFPIQLGTRATVFFSPAATLQAPPPVRRAARAARLLPRRRPNPTRPILPPAAAGHSPCPGRRPLPLCFARPCTQAATTPGPALCLAGPRSRRQGRRGYWLVPAPTPRGRARGYPRVPPGGRTRPHPRTAAVAGPPCASHDAPPAATPTPSSARAWSRHRAPLHPSTPDASADRAAQPTRPATPSPAGPAASTPPSLLHAGVLPRHASTARRGPVGVSDLASPHPSPCRERSRLWPPLPLLSGTVCLCSQQRHRSHSLPSSAVGPNSQPHRPTRSSWLHAPF